MPNAPDLPASAFALSFAGPSDYEQLMVELVNRARLDPTGELARQSTGFASGVTAQPRQALAVVAELDAAAQSHSDDMLRDNFFAHDNPFTGKTAFDRMRDAGYDTYRAAGENLGWIGSFANAYTPSRLTSHHDNLWDSAGHQRNLMSAAYSEIGVGFSVGPYDYNGITYPTSSMITQKFGDQGLSYLTGVVIDDADSDGFYDIGEGIGGVQIVAWGAAGTVATATWDAGGFSLALAPGLYDVEFIGGGLDGFYATTVTIGADNVKLDVIEGVDTSPIPLATTATGGADIATGTAAAELLTGAGGDDMLHGRGGSDRVLGGTGNDDIKGGGGVDHLEGGVGNDQIDGGRGRDRLEGQAGNDMLKGGFGNDRLNGGDGDDILRGGDGDDILSGGLGDDKLVGGRGADIFRFRAGDGDDRISDFDAVSDILRLDDALWGGGLTVSQMLAGFADDSGRPLVLSFAGGETLILNGIDNAVDIAGAIEIF